MTGAHPKLGLRSDDLRVGARKGMDLAARMGFGTIELGAITGDVAPENLSSSGRRHVMRYANQRGLSISALGGTLGGTVHHDVIGLERNLDQLRSILDLARDLNVATVTTAVGLIGPQDGEWFDRVREALSSVAEHADLIGCNVALTTSGGNPAGLATLIDTVNCDRIKVCYDPGELLMSGQDPLAPIEPLANHIGLSHIRDGMLGNAAHAGQETCLGRGQLDVAAYLGHLAQAGYHGPHILRRADSAQPSADLATGRQIMGAMIT